MTLCDNLLDCIVTLAVIFFLKKLIVEIMNGWIDDAMMYSKYTKHSEQVCTTVAVSCGYDT